MLADFEIGEHVFSAFTAGVVCSEHVGSHGFSETSRTTDADEALLSIENSVGMLNQFTLVDIDPRTQAHLKTFAGRIQIAAQWSHLLTWRRMKTIECYSYFTSNQGTYQVWIMMDKADRIGGRAVTASKAINSASGGMAIAD